MASTARPTTTETVEQQLERLLTTSETIRMANPKAVDPMREYKNALTRATLLGGKTTRLTSMRIHHANANGIVDVTADGSIEIFFASPGLARAGEGCYIEFFYEEGRAWLQRGVQTGKDDCTGGVAGPRCSLAEMVSRATAKGMVIGKKGVSFNRISSGWQISFDDTDDYFDDDCAP